MCRNQVTHDLSYQALKTFCDGSCFIVLVGVDSYCATDPCQQGW